ncbi:MAG: pyridoxamine 5'-phosphate oxidase family protein [Paracoccaceae bacterium]
MAKQVQSTDEAKKQLWSQLDDGRISMLSVPGSGQLPQPMTHFADRGAECLWFVTSAETDLVAALDAESSAQLVFMSPRQDYQASLTGRLEVVPDDDKLDELWNVAIAAWFEGGRSDPTARLLRFVPDEAAIWASDGNKVLVGLKMLRAGLTEGAEHPDVGVHTFIDFNKAA